MYFSPLFIKLTAEDCRQIYDSIHLFTSLTLPDSIAPALQQTNKYSRKRSTLPQQDMCHTCDRNKAWRNAEGKSVISQETEGRRRQEAFTKGEIRAEP